MHTTLGGYQYRCTYVHTRRHVVMMQYRISHSLLPSKKRVVVLCSPMSTLSSLVLRVTVKVHLLQNCIGNSTQPLSKLKNAKIPREGETLQVIVALEGKLLLVPTGTVIGLLRSSLLSTLCSLWVKWAV